MELIAVLAVAWAVVSTWAAYRYRAAAHAALKLTGQALGMLDDAQNGWARTLTERDEAMDIARTYQALAGGRKAARPSGEQSTRDRLN